MGPPFQGFWEVGDHVKSCSKDYDVYVQQMFEKIQVDLNDSLVKYAFEMFDSMKDEGLADEANKIFKPFLQIESRVPAVAVFTYMIDGLLNTGQTNMALNVYRYMLATGVTPSSYTYNLLIVGLTVAAQSDTNMLGVAKKCFVEMLDKGRKPNFDVCCRVFEGIACVDSQGVP
ncbi:putative pentatricopeptide [Rosa chinensis]|uniref:Putative pentatricopeptide n=1 Tax=Rosa chinensis TaxID=74649 RepID=A0A2P6QXP6_ROSCH|nr:putative pentatricopeptide [Rosa chinensis]